MSDTLKQVIEKVKKLLALAQSANEHEAALATARAQEMLARHNLDLATVEQAETQSGALKPENDPERHRPRREMKGSGLYKYQRTLWEGVAAVMYCWHWLQDVKIGNRRSTTRHILLGREANVVGVEVMVEYLEQAMRRLCPPPPPGHEYKWAVSWKEGCTKRLIERLWEARFERERREAANASCTALTLKSLHELEYERNYDSMMGPGAYKKSMEEWEKRKNQPVEDKPLSQEELDARREQEKEWRERQKREEARYWRKRDKLAFASGIQAADSIDLSQQVRTNDK